MVSPYGCSYLRNAYYVITCCITHVFVHSACKQLTMPSSEAHNLLRPNNLSGDLCDDFVNNFISFSEYSGRDRKLPFTNNARRWTEVQGFGRQMFLSVFIRCSYRKYFRDHFLIIMMKRKEKLTFRWHARNTHVMQTGSTLNLSIRDWNDLPQEVIEAKTIDTFVSRASRLQQSKIGFCAADPP